MRNGSIVAGISKGLLLMALAISGAPPKDHATTDMHQKAMKLLNTLAPRRIAGKCCNKFVWHRPKMWGNTINNMHPLLELCSISIQRLGSRILNFM